MSKKLQVISPVDGSIYVERDFHGSEDIQRVLKKAKEAQQDWKRLTVEERAVYLNKFVEAFTGNVDEISKELSWQMGRPIRYAPSEVRGTEERAVGMIGSAPHALKDIPTEEKDGFQRFIRREPLGIVFVVPAWNYPYLIAVNSVVPALMAGNAVVLKHSAQTPLCAEQFAKAFEKAGLPDGLFSFLHLTHEKTAEVIQNPLVNFVAFTGSVEGGRAIQQAAASRFIGVGLELGGKDPAYVRHDADLDYSIATLVDGAFFNSGQSCCGIERIYVHESLYDAFVDGFVELTKQYKLGNPLDPETTLGPVAKKSGAALVRRHIEEAVAAGAKALIDPTLFPYRETSELYLPPQVLVDVDHSMAVMRDETFGPVVGIMKVKDDEEAIRLMNDSPYGLTASIWSQNEEEALLIGDQIETGTYFMNRCDYLDPALAWVGVKNSGRGCTLSPVGYEYLTRPKSYHLKIKLS